MRGTLINALSGGGTALVSLALTPLLIHKLGNQAYGVWILGTTVTFGVGYLSFSDLGLEQAAVRFMSQARADEDLGRYNAYLSTTFFALLAVAAVITPLVVLLAHPIVGLFNIPPRLAPSAVVAFQFVLAQLAFDLPGRAFSAVLESAQRYGLWQVTRVAQVVLVSGVLAATALKGGGIDELGRASFAASGLSFAITLVVALLAVEGSRPSLRAVQRDAWNQLRTLSVDVFTLRLLSTIYRQIDKTVIGIMLAASLVTSYEIGNKLYGAAWLVQGVATSALVPSVAFTARNRDRLQEMLLRGSSYTLAVCLPVTLAGFIFAGPLIRTWIGTGHANAVGPARWLLASLIPWDVMVVGQTMLVGLGRVRPMVWMVAGWTVANVGFSIALARPLGVEGVVIATLFPSVVLVFPMMRYVFNVVGVPTQRFLSEAIYPAMAATFAQCAVGFPLLLLVGGTRLLPIVLIAALLSAVAGAAGYFLIGLNARRRRSLLMTLSQALGLERTHRRLRAESGLHDAPVPETAGMREPSALPEQGDLREITSEGE